MFGKYLIETLKQHKGLTKDSEVVEMLPKCTKGWLSSIKSGDKKMTEEQALFIAKECGINPEWVLVQLAEESAKSEEAKQVWTSLAKKLSRSAVAAVLAVVLVFCGVQSNNSGKAVFA